MRFIGDAEPLPTDTQIESEIVAHLPIVFEERHPFVLMKIAILLVIIRVIQPGDVFGIRLEAERLTDIGHGPGQVAEQILHALLVQRVETWDGDRRDSRYRYAASSAVVVAEHSGVRAWAELYLGKNLVRVPGIAVAVAEFGPRAP